jgi:hypothetical protein
VEDIILPAGGHDHMGCFTDQVKLTRALVRNLDEAVKEVKLLGEHEEESSQKITELETLCKKLRDDTQRLEVEKATLEEMVESRDELLMEIARETGLDRIGEDEEEEDADNGGDAAAPPISMDLSLFLYPAIVLLGILCLISIYTSDGQHKEPQQQQQREQQWGEQLGCQPATTPSTYS